MASLAELRESRSGCVPELLLYEAHASRETLTTELEEYLNKLQTRIGEAIKKHQHIPTDLITLLLGEVSLVFTAAPEVTVGGGTYTNTLEFKLFFLGIFLPVVTEIALQLSQCEPSKKRRNQGLVLAVFSLRLERLRKTLLDQHAAMQGLDQFLSVVLATQPESLGLLNLAHPELSS